MWRSSCATTLGLNFTIEAVVVAIDDAMLRLPPNEAATTSSTPCVQIDSFAGIVSALFAMGVSTTDNFSRRDVKVAGTVQRNEYKC